MELVKDLDKSELESFFIDRGFQRYRAEQLLIFLYRKRILSFDEVTTFPKELRKFLKEHLYISAIEDYEYQKASDGTIKFLFRLKKGSAVESVFIPSDNGLKERRTLCVSSQVGCALACVFCATGKLGLTRNLSAGEIIEQILFAEKFIGHRLTNLVFMGMGEPLQNYNQVVKAINILTSDEAQLFKPKNITVSTSGVVPKILELAKLLRPVKLAISLHSTYDQVRQMLMPIAKRWKIEDVRNSAIQYYRLTKIPITYEYILFDGVNDSLEDARRLAKIAISVPSKVNLIPYHSIDFMPLIGFAKELKPASMDRILLFKDWLKDLGVNAFVRSSNGIEIDGACGQLAFSKRRTE
ncbi:MAG: 23S rRNA (adenine(2503)-C(2))-methyltransferase RlmN [Candidatus Kapaibacteriales bacterium]